MAILQVVDQMSSEIICTDVLKTVTFTSLCGVKGDMVAYITVNETSGRMVVRVLETGADVAVQVCMCVCVSVCVCVCVCGRFMYVWSHCYVLLLCISM